ncbi:CotH kinase family protein [Rhodococcus gannanensis]|uniref:CotH kinase family protein n=1 Tax=Rhodococcus gannanensis TaxID=1960308 RepID=A0ABW4P9T7_9NOCA
MHPTFADGPPPTRRFRHRIPTSLRQHWKLLAVFVAFVTIMATVFGATRIRPQITGDATIIASQITDNIAGTVDLFDDSVSHEVSLDITDAEYQDMITSFQKTGEKKWVTADLTIDGTFVNDVSVRLKGNSTLMGVRGDNAMPGGEGFQPPEGMELPEGVEFPDGMEMPEGMGPMGGMSQASEDDPTSLPLLISFDENESGRAYQGLTEISIRPGSPVLNEAMSLSLTAETDQASQRYTYAVYSVNNSATTTRLLLEHPDDLYANTLFDSDGYLYKADANSRFEYVGDDQSDYADQFKQINAVDSGNLQPIINFLKWLDTASDEEFDAHLADWVDVDSVADYLATQNLLVNGDDMSGPGQNYYLWYDLETEEISVISWDLNLAMQGDATTGPHDAVSMGMPGGGGRAGAGAATAPEGMTLPEGMTPPDGMALPEGMTPPGGTGADDAAGTQNGQAQDGRTRGGGIGGGGPQMSNELKTRFLESDAFTAVYDEAYWDLYDRMYGGGLASETLERLAETIPVSDGLTAEDLQSSVDDMRTWIDQRTSALADQSTT